MRYPSPKGGDPPLPKFSAHVYRGQTVGWMKLVLGMEVGRSPGDFVLDGTQHPSPRNRGWSPLPNFRPIAIVDKRLDASRCHLVWCWPQPRGLCVRWRPSPPPQKKGGAPSSNFGPFWAHVYCGQTAGCIMMPLSTKVGVSSGDSVLDGDPAPSPQRVWSPLPNFRPISIVAKRLDASRCHLVWR